MAAGPLFNSDLSTLKANLRLSGAVTPDVEVLIAGAIQKARIVFYDRLGEARITALLAIAFNENPATADQIMRARANACEISLCRQFLMRALPTLFVEAAASASQSWNEEGIVRESGGRFRDELKRLDTEIQEYLEGLSGASSPDSAETSVSVIGPPLTNCYPGNKVFQPS